MHTLYNILWPSLNVIGGPSGPAAVPGLQALLRESATGPFPGSLWSACLWRNEGPPLEMFPSIKTPCEQTLKGPSPINAALTARGQTAERIHVNKSPRPVVTGLHQTNTKMMPVGWGHLTCLRCKKNRSEYSWNKWQLLICFILNYSFRTMLIITASTVDLCLTNFSQDLIFDQNTYVRKWRWWNIATCIDVKYELSAHTQDL